MTTLIVVDRNGDCQCVVAWKLDGSPHLVEPFNECSPCGCGSTVREANEADCAEKLGLSVSQLLQAAEFYRDRADYLFREGDRSVANGHEEDASEFRNIAARVREAQADMPRAAP